MSNTSKEYKGVFKSTFLFSFVQVIRLMVGIVKNKVAAMILGPSGMGIMGVFNTTISFIKTGAGLGVAQSAVRDVSEANGCGDKSRFSRVITLTNRIVLFTALLGFIITVALSPFLSKWGFGDTAYTLSFVFLALAVAFDIYVDNQLAILKGMRQLHSLAKASVMGSIAALVTGVPLFFIFKERGIVPSIIISAFATLVVSVYFVNKIKYDRIKLSRKEVFTESRSMITMGISLMLVSFLAVVFDYIIIAFIRKNGGLDIIGIYTAGTTIIGSYFGIVINAMTTDYYPRISAINSDDVKVQEAVNQQSEVGLVMVFPLAILFLYLTRFVIGVLYSSEFISAVEYTDFAMLGTIIMICSNSMGMVLLAKQKPKLFLTSVISQRVLSLVVFLFLYKYLGLRGLGIAYFIHGLVHLCVVSVIMGTQFKIFFKKKVLLNLCLVLVSCICAVFVRRLDNVVSYVVGALIIIFSALYSYIYMKREMNINILDSFKSRFFKKHL